MLEGELAAISRAWEFQKEAGISERPVSLEKYLSVAGAELRVRKDLEDAEAGQTFQVGGRHIIVVNGNHTPERQRFTILHELAHIRLGLPSNHERSISTDQLLKYTKRPREEIICDVFASECLLPRNLFHRDVQARPCTFKAIEELAAVYQASLAATGSRFVAYNKHHCGWVLSDEKRIRYVSCSSRLRDTGFFISPGIEVPAQSVLGRLSAGSVDVRSGRPETIPLYVWTHSNCRGVEELTETAILAPSFAQGLALISAEISDESRQSPQDDERDEDELLPELDGVLRFPGSRRRI
jgi:Zn-dependent peptidase ImmA (M78 family)